MWLLSRAIVIIVMLVVAPHVPVSQDGKIPVPGWGEFEHWDGGWYRFIATSGFEFAPDGGQHSVAFFPLYPVVTAIVMRSGAPFAVAGTLVANAAFAGMLAVAFLWTRERAGRTVARWTVAVLCFCPLSMFGSVTYSEALFMLLSTAALRDYDRARFGRAGLWAALASATRITGAGLLPAFAIAAYVRKSGPRAYASALAALAGPLAFSVYCAFAFRDPLATLRAQSAWRHGLGFVPEPWEGLISSGTNGLDRWPYQVAIVVLVVWFWRQRATIAPWVAYLVSLFLVAAESSVWTNNREKVFMVFVGGYFVWRFRAVLGTPAFVFGAVALLLIAVSGVPISAERIAYGVVPFSFAIGVAFSRVPIVGAATLTVCANELAYFALAFAQWRWVA